MHTESGVCRKPVVYSLFSSVFHFWAGSVQQVFRASEQLPVAAGNKVDESGKSESKQHHCEP